MITFVVEILWGLKYIELYGLLELKVSKAFETLFSTTPKIKGSRECIQTLHHLNYIDFQDYIFVISIFI